MMSIRASPPWSSAASEGGGPGKEEQKVDVIEGQSVIASPEVLKVVQR